MTKNERKYPEDYWMGFGISVGAKKQGQHPSGVRAVTGKAKEEVRA